MAGSAKQMQAKESAGSDAAAARATLMAGHVAARARRDEAPLGSDAFRRAAEEVARIEVAIARLEEPSVK